MKNRFVAAAVCALAHSMIAQPAHAQAAAIGDPVMGKKQFLQCMACHADKADAKDMTGPNLFGVYGSKAATRRTTFKYSPALKAAKLTWDDATLDRWITDPAQVVKGTEMEFVGIPRRPARQNIIAYLKTLK